MALFLYIFDKKNITQNVKFIISLFILSFFFAKAQIQKKGGVQNLPKYARQKKQLDA